MANLYVLTLHWQNERRLKSLAPTLISSLDNLGCNWNWLIKNNAGNLQDASTQYINSLGNDKITMIQYPDNQQNFAEGCNYLFNFATPQDDDYIMLLNNDIIFNDDLSIKNMLNILKDPEVGMVGARLLYTNTNKLQHTGCTFVKNWNTPDNYRRGQISDSDAEQNREFQAITGAACITKAKYYRNANHGKMMDQNLIWCFEDIDLCLSIKYDLGKKIVYCGHTNIFHEESASLKKNPMNKLMLNHNLSYFLNKWRGRYKIDTDDYVKNSKHNLYFGVK